MKILQVFDWFSLPHGGGTVDLVYKMSRALAQKGHEVTIYTSDFELDQKYIDSLSEVKVRTFRCLSNLAGFYIMPEMIGEVRKELKRFDIVHLHSLRSFQNVVIHHYAKKFVIPYIVDTHGSLPRGHGKKGFKWLLKWLFDAIYGYRILHSASQVVAQTEVGVSEYKTFGIKPDKITVISPPLVVEEFSQLPPVGLFRQKYNLKDKKIIMFLGRLNWIKGLDFLVESFAELVKSRNNTTLVIVGNDDGFKATLDKLIEESNLQGRVLFTGFLSGKDKLSALVDADVVVQTSRYEQGAWAPLEAVLCNTPIIVSRDTGAGEDVRRIDAGYLVEFGNKKEFGDTVQYIFDHSAEAKSKALKAKEYIKANLSMNKVIGKYEQLYKVCASH